jgi:IS4 transposase
VTAAASPAAATYPDRVHYQCLVTTDLSLTPEQLHQCNRDRWAIEESFMDLTRYWGLDQVGSCRPAVAAAQVHFILLAYTLLHLYAA